MLRLATLMTGAALLLPALPARAQPDDDFAADEETVADEGASSGDSDHASHVGALGLGFMGARFVPSAVGGEAPAVVLTEEGDAVVTIESDDVTVPLFGLRYWMSSRFGVELGFGFNVAGGSIRREIPNPDPSRTHTVEFATPSTTAVAGHLGIPVSVYSTGHLNVLLLPEVDLGYASSAVESYELSTAGEWLDLRLSGFLFGAGARLGAELGFGFIDLPQVTLQLSWGLRIEYLRSTGRIGDASMTIANTQVGTSWYDDPWRLLAGNVGAYYYF